MIYKRIIEFNNNSNLLLEKNNNLSFGKFKKNKFYIDISNLDSSKKSSIFYGNLLDFLVLYNFNNYFGYSYFAIYDLSDNIIIFEKNLMYDFILKYISLHKNRQLFIKIMLGNIKNYYINQSECVIRKSYKEKLSLLSKKDFLKNKIIFFH